MRAEHAPRLVTRLYRGGEATRLNTGGWRLEIPPGPKGSYRLAQLEDYYQLGRSDYPWEAAMKFSVRARASAEMIPGTWGFGLWNDPFSMAFLRRAEPLRLPALPNAAWFFFASPPNYLSLRDDLPARGGLAATFRSPRLPGLLLALGAPALPLALIPPAARLLRRIGRRIVRQDAAQMDFVPTSWHTYVLEWRPASVIFQVDERVVFETGIVPNGPLGLVLWVDNQYVAMPPDGRVRIGTLENAEAAWMEIEALQVESAIA